MQLLSNFSSGRSVTKLRALLRAGSRFQTGAPARSQVVCPGNSFANKRLTYVLELVGSCMIATAFFALALFA